MKKLYDVIIIGGGIIGCSIAYQQAKLHKKVLIIEKNQLGSEATSAAAGMLGAQAEIDEDLSMLRLALKSRSMFPTLIKELEELTGIDIGFVNRGMIKVAKTNSEVDGLIEQIQFHREWDAEVTWYDEKELFQREGALSKNLVGGMYIPNDGQLISTNLSKAFAKAALHYGAEVVESTEVRDLIFDGDKVQGVHTPTGALHGETVVITTGAWATELLKKVNLQLEITPVKGECFSVIPDKPLITSTILGNGCYIVPKKDGRIIVGATSLPNRFDKSVSIEGLSILMNRALTLVPDLKNAAWEKAWAGIRPQTKDHLPYIGGHPSYKGLLIAVGHFRNGILLSPITGTMISEMIENQVSYVNQPLYDAFKVDRAILA